MLTANLVRRFWLTTCIKVAVVLLSVGLSAPYAQADDLALPPQAQLAASRSEPLGSLRLPSGPFQNGVLPTKLVEGAIDIRAYRIPLEAGSTLQLMSDLRDQLLVAGLKVDFECEAEACGGFDFRYGLDVLPEPDMHVNLGDFRYLSARSGAGHHLALLVSRADQIGFVQVTRVVGQGGSGPVQPPLVTDKPDLQPVAKPDDLTAAPAAPELVAGLEAGLSAALDDLVFEPGASSLSGGAYGSLSQLAAWLSEDPRRQVVVVGHTDASGGLEANLRLSRLRAESVRQALIRAPGILPEQVAAEGVGPLSPRATNLTEEGRRQNRRVEVMVTSTDLLMR